MSAATIASLRIGQEKCILEAKVYRRWISKSVPDMKALAYCCIPINRENNAIQATMDVNNIDYFSQLLQPHAAYKISNFIYERTKLYQQTLENQITLRFGKITVFEPLPVKESEFPDHHFELISYYQLPSRIPYKDENSKLVYLILTDYLGRVRSISDIMPFQTSTASEKYLRKVDIEDLDGNIVEFTMWDELATQFDKKEIEKLTPPIIIAVSSCRVTRYKATPATHYYINPQTAEAKRVYTIFKEKYNSNPPLQIAKYRCQDPDECSKASNKLNDTYVCEDHGKQDPVTYRYKFKTAVADGTATTQFTFFTKAEIVNTIGKRRIFQIRYASSTQRGAAAFIADDVLDIQPAIQIEGAGNAVAASSATPSKETAGKEKHITGLIEHQHNHA
ncbi:nucleic acid-binding, OB-fold protein [Tanacetum coccineum]